MITMGEVYFVRHGQASYGAANYDKLSDLGHQQSRWLGQHLAHTVGGFDRVISGDLTRHRETLAGLQHSLKHAQTHEDDRLNEMSYFAMERAYNAVTGEEPPTTQPDLAHHFARVMAAWEGGKIPGEPEKYAAFQTRVLAAFLEHATHGEKILVVSSGGPMGIAIRHVLGLDLRAMIDIILHTHNASYSRFSVDQDRLRLVQFNVISHLEHPERQHAQTLL